MKRAAPCGFMLLLSLFCSACAAHAPSSEDTLRVGVYGEPESLNPLLGNFSVDVFLASLAFDDLVTVDSNGNDVAQLAARVPTLQNGDISKSGVTIRYRLRKNVRWQDGAPFTSADVKFSWQAMMNPKNNVSTRVGFDDVASVDTPGPYTVVFHLKRPYAPFVDTVFGEGGNSYRVLPAHLLERYTDLNEIPFDHQPIGTGPFRVVRWVRGDYVEYAANDRYFLGSPKLRRLLVSFIPNDSTLANEVRSHEIDLAPELTPFVYNSLRAVPGFRGVDVPAPATSAIMMNVSHAPLNDVRVRRAIAYDIDKRLIVRDLLYGVEPVATSGISPYYGWAHDSTIRTYEYDPAKAQQLLDKAGWTVGGDGIRVKSGKPLSLHLVIMSQRASAAKFAVFIQSALARIGIDVRIRAYPAAQLFGTGPSAILESGNFDININGWDTGADPDDSSIWLCKQIPPAGQNLTRYCDPQVDAYEGIALTHFDRETRRRAYQAVQQTLAKDVPVVFTYYGRSLYVVSSRLRHFEPNALSLAWNAYQWSW